MSPGCLMTANLPPKALLTGQKRRLRASMAEILQPGCRISRYKRLRVCLKIQRGPVFAERPETLAVKTRTTAWTLSGAGSGRFIQRLVLACDRRMNLFDGFPPNEMCAPRSRQLTHPHTRHFKSTTSFCNGCFGSRQWSCTLAPAFPTRRSIHPNGGPGANKNPVAGRLTRFSPSITK